MVRGHLLSLRTYFLFKKINSHQHGIYELVAGVFGPAHVIMELITWAMKQEKQQYEYGSREDSD